MGTAKERAASVGAPSGPTSRLPAAAASGATAAKAAVRPYSRFRTTRQHGAPAPTQVGALGLDVKAGGEASERDRGLEVKAEGQL